MGEKYDYCMPMIPANHRKGGYEAKRMHLTTSLVIQRLQSRKLWSTSGIRTMVKDKKPVCLRMQFKYGRKR